MQLYDVIGIIGAILLSIQNLPQIYLIYQKKNMDEISSIFLCIGLIASTLLLVTSIHYGILSFLIVNIVCLFTLSILSIQKIYYSNKKLEKDDEINV